MRSSQFKLSLCSQLFKGGNIAFEALTFEQCHIHHYNFVNCVCWGDMGTLSNQFIFCYLTTDNSCCPLCHYLFCFYFLFGMETYCTSLLCNFGPMIYAIVYTLTFLIFVHAGRECYSSPGLQWHGSWLASRQANTYFQRMFQTYCSL